MRLLLYFLLGLLLVDMILVGLLYIRDKGEEVLYAVWAYVVLVLLAEMVRERI